MYHVHSHLPWCVESSVVDGVVVALGQELDLPVLLLVQLQHSVHDGNIATFNLWKGTLVSQTMALSCKQDVVADLEDDDFTNSDVLRVVVGQEEEVSPVEGGLHRAGENHHDGRFGPSPHHQTLPDHQCGGHDHAKGQNLRERTHVDSNKTIIKNRCKEGPAQG